MKTTLNIYLVQRTGAIGLDEHGAAVIVADSARAAIEIAGRELEPSEDWLNEDIVAVRKVSTTTAGIVLSSFRAG